MWSISSAELGLGESLLERDGETLKEGLDQLLELLTLDHSADIGVLHQRLDVQGGLGVCRQNLLELLGGGGDTGPGLGVGADVNLELLLELIGKVLGQSLVEVTATKVTVVGGGLDVELTLAELDNGGRCSRCNQCRRTQHGGASPRAREGPSLVIP